MKAGFSSEESLNDEIHRLDELLAQSEQRELALLTQVPNLKAVVDSIFREEQPPRATRDWQSDITGYGGGYTTDWYLPKDAFNEEEIIVFREVVALRRKTGIARAHRDFLKGKALVAGSLHSGEGSKTAMPSEKTDSEQEGGQATQKVAMDKPKSLQALLVQQGMEKLRQEENQKIVERLPETVYKAALEAAV